MDLAGIGLDSRSVLDRDMCHFTAGGGMIVTCLIKADVHHGELAVSTHKL
jgi:hypothetical protein